MPEYQQQTPAPAPVSTERVASTPDSYGDLQSVAGNEFVQELLEGGVSPEAGTRLAAVVHSTDAASPLVHDLELASVMVPAHIDGGDVAALRTDGGASERLAAQVEGVVGSGRSVLAAVLAEAPDAGSFDGFTQAEAAVDALEGTHQGLAPDLAESFSLRGEDAGLSSPLSGFIHRRVDELTPTVRRVARILALGSSGAAATGTDASRVAASMHDVLGEAAGAELAFLREIVAESGASGAVLAGVAHRLDGTAAPAVPDALAIDVTPDAMQTLDPSLQHLSSDELAVTQTGVSAGWGAGGPTATAYRQRDVTMSQDMTNPEAKDDYRATSRQAATYGGGAVTLTHADSTMVRTEDGEVTTGNQVQVVAGADQLYSSYQQSRGDGITTDQLGGGAGFDKDGLRLDASRAHTVSAVEGQSLQTTDALSFRGGNGSYNRSTQDTWVDDDGRTVQDGTSGGLAVGKDGVVLSGGRTHQVTDADGSVVATGVSGNVNVMEGQASGTYTSQRTGTDGVQRGVSAGGNLDVDADGYAVGANAGVTRGPVGANLSVQHSHHSNVSDEAADVFGNVGPDGLRETDQTGATGGVNASMGLVSISAGGGYSTAHEQTLAAGEDGAVISNEMDTDTLSYNAGMSTVGVGMQFGGAHADYNGQQVEFYDTPAGRAAYETYQRTGNLPQDTSGYRVLSDTVGTTDTEQDGVSALGAQYGHASVVDDRVITTPDHRIEQTTGTEDTSLSIPLLGHFHESHSLRQVEVDDEHRYYHATSVIDSTSGEDAMSGLVGATGMADTRDRLGDASGVWTVTSEFSEPEMDRFIESVAGSRVRHGDMGELREALREAGGDTDAQRRAVAEYISETGDTGIDEIRDRGGSPTLYVELEGDEYFRGAAGRRELERTLADYRSRVSNPDEDLSALLAAVRQTTGYVQRRIGVLGDRSSYAELPRDLRQLELRRSQGDLMELEALRDQAVGTMAQGGGGQSGEVSVESEAPAYEVEMARLEGQFTEKKEQMEDAYREARRHRWVHDGAWTMFPGRRELGYTSLFGDGPEADAYSRADGGMFFAEQVRSVALSFESTYYGVAVTDEATAATARETLTQSGRACDMARERFERVSAIYQSVVDRNPSTNMWHGYRERFPDGE